MTRMSGEFQTTRRRRSGLPPSCVLLLAMLVGCENPPKQSPKSVLSPPPQKIVNTTPQEPPKSTIDPTKVAERDDIVSIHHFWQQFPWRHDGSSGKVVGFGVPTYFASAETERGAFVSGAIHVWLSELSRAESGELERKPLHEWVMTESEAMNFRARKQTITGYGYGFFLNWPREMDLGGHSVEIQFGYQRADGKMIRGQPWRGRVPSPDDVAPVPPRPMPAARHPAARPAGDQTAAGSPRTP
ncbi:MAG: hypothetical protein U1D55_15630 [Phycisphaerae bacterium]